MQPKRNREVSDTNGTWAGTVDLHGAGGTPVRSAGRGHRGGSASRVRRGRVERRKLPRLRPGILCRLGAVRGVPAGYAAGGRRLVGAFRGRSDAARLPDSAAGRDCQARHDRRAAQRNQTPRAAVGSVLRHALGAQPTGAGTVRAEPVYGYQAATLQPGRGAAVAGHRAVHQRAAGVHVRVEEQPHQADGGRRGVAVPAGSQPAREAVRVRALHRALRGG